jgi:hypothetical protein
MIKNERLQKPNTNNFPLNGGFPEWITKKTCGGCKNTINFADYNEVGFLVNGTSSGRLFIKYKCQHCDNEGTIEFGDNEKFTLERLCTLVIQHSNILKTFDKINWKNKHIKP